MVCVGRKMEDSRWVSEIVSGTHRYKRHPGQGTRWGGRELGLRFMVADIVGDDIGSSCCLCTEECFQRLSSTLLCFHVGLIYCISLTCFNFICDSCGGVEHAILTAASYL